MFGSLNMYLAQGENHLQKDFLKVQFRAVSPGWDPMKSLGTGRFLIKGTLCGEGFAYYLLLSLVSSVSFGSSVCPSFRCPSLKWNLPYSYCLSVFTIQIESSWTGCSSYLYRTQHNRHRSQLGLFDNFVNITVTSKRKTFCKRDEEEMTEIKAGAGSCLPYKMIKIGRLCGLGRGQASLFFILVPCPLVLRAIPS